MMRYGPAPSNRISATNPGLKLAALSHWHCQYRTPAATRWSYLHIEEVVDRIKEALRGVITIVHVEPGATMLHGDESVRRAIAAARMHDELLRQIDCSSLA